MKISMSFALDRNQNNKIEQDEVVRLSELRSQDKDGNNALSGEELHSVYYEYGEDSWLSGGRTHVIRKQDHTQRVHLSELRFDPPAIDMKVDITL